MSFLTYAHRDLLISCSPVGFRNSLMLQPPYGYAQLIPPQPKSDSAPAVMTDGMMKFSLPVPALSLFAPPLFPHPTIARENVEFSAFILGEEYHIIPISNEHQQYACNVLNLGESRIILVHVRL
ncbi:hypothetical protein Vretimale_12999 [Volvox reticuliferus]|uniref:Uncharacterized protein n=1 Tax=Volvox reticuliferus TaxID=1737510 RepID=A0A8J4D0T9_9CHLO|nr:hypothetical protein Vretifemale_20357 [Volvox reticuliferus]GIM09139.1 hypothetical protein Vretimale_12999 [Volvox reticuliferus]